MYTYKLACCVRHILKLTINGEWGATDEEYCPLCESGAENRNHLFFSKQLQQAYTSETEKQIKM